MTKRILLVLVSGFCLSGTATSRGGVGPFQTTSADIVRLDPALDAIVSTDVALEVLNSSFRLTEGPVWISGAPGHLLFSDVGGNTIYKWSAENTSSVFLTESGNANGLARDRLGRLVFCATGTRAIVRLETDGTRTTLADRFEGKRFNAPNDIAVRSDGTLYFTDPPGSGRDREMTFSGVFAINDGVTRLIERDLRPNGLAFSPDERHLYLTDWGPPSRVIRYDVRPDGSIANGRVFADVSVDNVPGGADGMKVDLKGNVFVAKNSFTPGLGGVWIFSPEGKHLGTIRTPEGPTNLAFGDADGQTLYVTAKKTLARIRLATPAFRR